MEKILNNFKNLIISFGFVSFLIIALIINICLEDKNISETERRKLAKFPEINAKSILNGEAMKKFENYTIDQFMGRDFFRSIKSYFSAELLNQKDTNGLFEKNGMIFKMEYSLNENNVIKTAEKIDNICSKYLQNMNVYYAIIPDKNYYLENDDHLKIDYNKLKQIFNENLENINYIDIWNELELEDYYKTDAHWRQENLSEVVYKIKQEMNVKNLENIEYKKIDEGDFYGGYYGQLGKSMSPDKLYILTNETIKNCKTYNYETEEYGKIYSKPKTSDKYDTFLEGATPIIKIENPSSKQNKELLLFRDSYGSSIAPLLVENYKKITLIDVRYISSDLLAKYIEFRNQDVLFLYSTLVINQNILK